MSFYFTDSRKAVEHLPLRSRPCTEGVQLYQKEKMEGDLRHTSIPRTPKLPITS